DPVARGLRTLPGSLGEALDALKQDTVIQAALGEHIFDRYVEAKQQEWHEYRLYVSQWELDRYLPIY
ncbi:MAG TPA: glutamine synthetase, partial [Herpetosiphonaceae bacterium]|nr:glutamine synthetase [Herpetosiphonaceae bacterium]